MLADKKRPTEITVRQLESLVLLSEALARIHLDDEVRPPYVREAYRLLRKSIIHVDVQDIDLDDGNEESDLGTAKPIANPAEEEHDFDLHPPDEDDDNDRGDDDGNGEGGGGGTSGALKTTEAETMQSADGETQELDAEAAQNKADQSEEATLPKQAAAPKMKISLEKYQAITLSIVRYLRQQEEATATLTATGDAQGDDDEDDPDEESFGKIPQAKVVQWHLDQNSGEFESEDMVEHERALVNKVIHRLVSRDHILLVAHDEQSAQEEDSERKRDLRLLFVNPNFVDN